MEVTDNFMSEHFSNVLEESLTGEFTWYFTPQSVTLTDDCLVKDNTYTSPQMYHMFMHDGQITSNYYYLISPLVESIMQKYSDKIYLPWRIKANLLFQEPNRKEGTYQHPHCDWAFQNVDNEKYYSTVYYVNDSDGDTYLFNEDYENRDNLTLKGSVSPHKNRLVLFKSNNWHSASNPTVGYRIVINIVWQIKGEQNG